MKVKFAALCLIASSTASSIASAQALDLEANDSFDFAVKQTPDWTLKATTKVDLRNASRGGQPTIADIYCEGEGPQFTFRLSDVGEVEWLSMGIIGGTAEGGDERMSVLLGDHLWLYLDGERWEFANIPRRPSSFLNVPQPKINIDEIVIPVWRGHQAVRKAEGQPWLHISRLYEKIISADKIEWSFKSRDWSVVNKSIIENQLPQHWKIARYPLNNRGLRDAVSWCAMQVSSDAAYILPDRIKGNLSR